VIHYTESNYRYQLARAYTHAADLQGHGGNAFVYLADGALILRPGYAWDGASGPAINTKNFVRGSLVHDALYQLIRLGVLPASARKYADQELVRITREDGMSALRAAWVYAAVRLGGGFALSRATETTVKTAP
jgi:hypothetical protein